MKLGPDPAKVSSGVDLLAAMSLGADLKLALPG